MSCPFMWTMLLQRTWKKYTLDWHFLVIKIRSQQFCPVASCVCLCKFICLPDKQSPQPVHFVPEPSLLKRESQTWIMWLSWTGLLAGLKLDFKCGVRLSFNLIQMCLFIQTCTHNLFLLVETKKLPHLAEVCNSSHIFHALAFGGARLLMRASP